MENESKLNTILDQLDGLVDLPEKYRETLKSLFVSFYMTTQKSGTSMSFLFRVFETFIELLKEQAREPSVFEPYHQKLPNHHTFALDFLRPIVDIEHSSIRGIEHAHQISHYLQQKDNVILFSNHQTEADPQAIGLLLEKAELDLIKDIIFVAGERVITDPLAVPFSLGLNLLCIYSKRYIDQPPELKLKKQLHNKRTMEIMSQLLKEGGKCIWVAPSGGRDRPNPEGIVQVAPFDPQSIEMFYLMAQKAAHPTHFFPLALDTYDLFPPPKTIQIELGEERSANRGPIHMAFGKEIDMHQAFPQVQEDRHERRKLRAQHIHDVVQEMYKLF
jgi:glycerol-3-phosphate O-acyltransferase